MVQVTSPAFKQNAARAMADAGLHKALGTAKGAFLQRRAVAVANLPEFERLREIEAEVDGRVVSLPRPERLGDVSFMYLEGFREGPGDTALVLVRRRGTWESLRGLFHRDDPAVLEWSVEPGDWLVQDEPAP